MNVLVGCEFSGVVRDAFRREGHNAISCDLLPAEGEHYQGDIMDVVWEGWDLAIFHPPCTFLTCSAEWAYADKQTRNIKPGTLVGEDRRNAREDAVEFFLALVRSDIPKIAVENPVGVMSTRYRKPDQYIQPYEYGHDASKKTGLWLKGLPTLKPTKYIPPRMVNGLPRWANQTDSGQNRVPPSDNRWKIRSETYQGWANAMATQWGNLDEFNIT